MSHTSALNLGLLQRMPPALAALAAHIPALVLGAFLLVSGTAASITVLCVGVTAALIAWLWHLPVWWRAINLLFVPGLWLAQTADVPPAWYLGAFLLLALTSLGAVRTRVPLFLSSDKAVEALVQTLPADARFIDLGCGLGGPLAGLSTLRPDLKLEGVEAAPLNWLIARLRLGRKAKIRFGSLWDVDLSRYDAVYAYLSPAPMSRLWDKARTEMKPGSLFISNSFAVPGTAPQKSIELHDLAQSRLLVWRLK